MNVVVSAFITNINTRYDRNVATYIDYGKKLIYNIDCYKVIFMERAIFQEYFNICPNEMDPNEMDPNEMGAENFTYENKMFKYVIINKNIFVFFEKNEIYLYNYINLITKFNVHTDNPSKDTLEYMFVQCHKTEWVNIAIKLITYIKEQNVLLVLTDKTPDFIWVDFGIYHMFKNVMDVFNNSFEHLSALSISNNKIRIASCIHPDTKNNADLYKNVVWYFAGSVFGGSANTLNHFAEIMKMECINIIKEKNHLMWEVNIWYLIYMKHRNLFDPYLCGHTANIIQNY